MLAACGLGGGLRSSGVGLRAEEVEANGGAGLFAAAVEGVRLRVYQP